MSAAEPVSVAVARGVMALEHMLICRDLARVMAPKALAGDREAIKTIRWAAAHMRMLKGGRHD
ncbi:hypothetical protein IU433_14700 [Nocardia puris]|uniref:hypothetical protein n=1 Tax=Nocardia puris TaxID=208602 RepID=UPI001894D093|nr:hypothetical protein [Nocardia puris]MBF6460288.1 hypothetical protein [Nocardia puris]